jgi:hypothetical protein
MGRPAALCFLLVCIVLGITVSAETGSKTSRITFVGVQHHESAPLCCYRGGTDQLLTADTYHYNVSLKSGCTVYTGRYENFYDYFPAFRPGQAVNAQIGKRVMTLSTPSGEHLTMSIIDRTRVAGCGSAGQ